MISDLVSKCRDFVKRILMTTDPVSQRRGFLIRPATAFDTDALVNIAAGTAIFHPADIASLRTLLIKYHTDNKAEIGHAVVKLEEGRRILGFAYYSPILEEADDLLGYAYSPYELNNRVFLLWWIAVVPDQQAHGIGSRLLRYVEDDLRNHHEPCVLYIDTSSSQPYESARQFYLKHGYEQHTVWPDFYADGYSRVTFRKRLS